MASNYLVIYVESMKNFIVVDEESIIAGVIKIGSPVVFLYEQPESGNIHYIGSYEDCEMKCNDFIRKITDRANNIGGAKRKYAHLTREELEEKIYVLENEQRKLLQKLDTKNSELVQVKRSHPNNYQFNLIFDELKDIKNMMKFANSYNSPVHTSISSSYGTIPSNHSSVLSNRGSIPPNRGSTPSNHGTTSLNHGSIPSNHDSIPLDHVPILPSHQSISSNHASAPSNLIYSDDSMVPIFEGSSIYVARERYEKACSGKSISFFVKTIFTAIFNPEDFMGKTLTGKNNQKLNPQKVNELKRAIRSKNIEPWNERTVNKAICEKVSKLNKGTYSKVDYDDWDEEIQKEYKRLVAENASKKASPTTPTVVTFTQDQYAEETFIIQTESI